MINIQMFHGKLANSLSNTIRVASDSDAMVFVTSDSPGAAHIRINTEGGSAVPVSPGNVGQFQIPANQYLYLYAVGALEYAISITPPDATLS